MRKLAQSMGWYAEGPITDPKDLGPALKRAVAVVKRGRAGPAGHRYSAALEKGQPCTH